MRLLILVLCLLACGSVAAQDETSASDYREGISLSGAREQAGNEFYGEPAEGQDPPLELYAGADYVWSEVSFSKAAFIEDFGDDELSSSMYRVRAGMRVHERIGVEAQVGLGATDTDDLAADEYSTSRFYALYLVPTGVLLDLVEVAASIGYAYTELERAEVSESLGGASFGINVEVPLYTGAAYELRAAAGGALFRTQDSARIYGYHAGLRVDFKI